MGLGLAEGNEMHVKTRDLPPCLVVILHMGRLLPLKGLLGPVAAALDWSNIPGVACAIRRFNS